GATAWPGAVAWAAGVTTVAGARGMGARWLMGAGVRGPAQAARTRVARTSPAPLARNAAGKAGAMPSAARTRVSWPRFMGTTSNRPTASFGAGLQRNESYRIEDLQLPALLVPALDEMQRLSRAVVDRRDETRPWAQLFEERLRYLVARCRDDDGVVGRHLRHAQAPVAEDEAQVAESQAAQVRPRCLVQSAQALDRHDLPDEMREQRGLVPAARADLENLGRGARRGVEGLERELEHARDGAGSRDGLAEADRERDVVVGATRETLVHEGVSRHRRHRGEHRLVAHAEPPQLLRHGCAPARRRKPQARRRHRRRGGADAAHARGRRRPALR